MVALDAILDDPIVAPAPGRRFGAVMWLALAWLALVFAAAVLADLLPLPSPYDMDMLGRRLPPDAEHLLGTDGLGRDMLARVIFGARTSLTVGLVSAAIGLVAGGTIGMLAGYFGGRFEVLAMGAVDVLLAFPPLVLALAITAFLGVSVVNLTVTIGFLSIPPFARVARATTLSLARRDFVTAARALGATHTRILTRELLPNVLLPLTAFFLIAVAVTIVVEGALSLLGLGVPPPQASWGSMIGEGRESLELAPWLSFIPAGVMFLTVLSFNFVGDRLRALTDPRPGALLSVLSLKKVTVRLATPRGILRAVDRVDLTLEAGSTLGIVGESGCGKTMLARAILRLLPRTGAMSGQVWFDGHDLTRLAAKDLRRLRGRSLAVVFQDPMTSLNPVLTIGRQITETLREHLEMDAATAARRAVELIAEVGIPEPEQRLRQYPHQLSGGMRQRVAIAIALSCEPKLLIADEPTTALDVTVQAQILDLLAREQRRRQMAMILITHDLGVVAGRTNEVAVMYAGRVVERAPTPLIFRDMRMPYTQALLAAIPRIDTPPHTRLPTIAGRPPDPMRRPVGCAFAPRCAYADNRCRHELPPLRGPDEAGHRFACWNPLDAPPLVPA